jgi:hypothetical protein
MSDEFSTPARSDEQIRELLARAPAIRSFGELGLLLSLYRHPRTFLTNDQFATLAGYDMKLATG